MDPSNNNAFDSFGNNAGAGNGASVGGASAGAGIGSGATITSPNTGATNSGSIVSSGATAVNNEYTSNSFPEGGLTIGGDKKRSRKGLIIAGIVFFVLAIGGGLAALAAMNGVFEGGNQVLKENVGEKYNRFANYVINGTEEKSAIESEYDVSGDYYFFDEISNVDTSSTFLAKVLELWNSFKNEYDRASINNDNLKEIIEDENDILNLTTVLNSKDSLDGSVVLDYYLENGISATKEHFKSYYYDVLDSSNEYMVEFDDLYSKWVDAQVDYYDLFSINGCVTNNMINVACLFGTNDNTIIDKRASLNNQVAEYNERLTVYYNLSSNIMYNVFKINELLRGLSE